MLLNVMTKYGALEGVPSPVKEGIAIFKGVAVRGAAGGRAPLARTPAAREVGGRAQVRHIHGGRYAEPPEGSVLR